MCNELGMIMAAAHKFVMMGDIINNLGLKNTRKMLPCSTDNIKCNNSNNNNWKQPSIENRQISHPTCNCISNINCPYDYHQNKCTLILRMNYAKCFYLFFPIRSSLFFRFSQLPLQMLLRSQWILFTHLNSSISLSVFVYSSVRISFKWRQQSEKTNI